MKLPEDIKTWNPERVFEYMTQELEDSEYRSICQLLYNFSDGIDILFNTIQDGRVLSVWYPQMQGDFPYSNNTIVGDVMDGLLYIKPE